MFLYYYIIKIEHIKLQQQIIATKSNEKNSIIWDIFSRTTTPVVPLKFRQHNTFYVVSVLSVSVYVCICHMSVSVSISVSVSVFCLCSVHVCVLSVSVFVCVCFHDENLTQGLLAQFPHIAEIYPDCLDGCKWLVQWYSKHSPQQLQLLDRCICKAVTTVSIPPACL